MALASCSLIPGESWRSSSLRTAAVVVLAIPLLATLARGSGLWTLARGLAAVPKA